MDRSKDIPFGSGWAMNLMLIFHAAIRAIKIVNGRGNVVYALRV